MSRAQESQNQEIKNKVLNKYRSCKTFEKLKQERGVLAAALTRAVNNAHKLCSDFLDGKSTEVTLLGRALQFLQESRTASAFFNDLLIENYFSEERREKYSAEYQSALEYAETYESRWLSARHALYVQINDLWPTPQVRESLKASEPDRRCYAPLFIPTFSQAEREALGDLYGDTDDDDDGERTLASPLLTVDDEFQDAMSTEEGAGGGAGVGEKSPPLADGGGGNGDGGDGGGNAVAGDGVQLPQDQITPPQDQQLPVQQSPQVQVQQSPQVQHDQANPQADASAAAAAADAAAQQLAAQQHAAAMAAQQQQQAHQQAAFAAAAVPPGLPYQQQFPGMAANNANINITVPPPFARPPPVSVQNFTAYKPPSWMLPTTSMRGAAPFANATRPTSSQATVNQGLGLGAIPKNKGLGTVPKNTYGIGLNPGASSLNLGASSLNPSNVSSSAPQSILFPTPRFATPPPTNASVLGGGNVNASVSGGANLNASVASGGNYNAQSMPFNSFFPGITDPNSSVLRMLSRSMACSFSIENYVKKKFNGHNYREYPEWLSQWKRADSAMTDLLYTEEDKFSVLKSALSDLALSYCASLPIDSSESYRISLATLDYMYYDRKVTLQSEICKLLAMAPCTGSFESRQKIHSSLVAFSNSVSAMGATDEHLAVGFQLVICGRVLDALWQKDLVKFLNKNKDISNPLGANVSFHDIISVLFQSMMEQQQIKNFGSNLAQRGALGGQAPGQNNVRPPYRGKTGASAAAAVKQIDEKTGEKESAKLLPLTWQGSNSATIQLPTETDKLNDLREWIQSTAAAAATGNKQGQGQGKNSMTNKSGKKGEIKVACIFCSTGTGPNSTQQYKHSHPLNCVKIKNKELTLPQIKQIVLKAKGCRNCGSPHLAKDCTAPDFVHCRVKDPETNQICGQRHMNCFHNPNYKKGAAAAAQN